MLPVISRNWFPTLFDVFDADMPIYCMGFHLRRFRFATPAVKHSEAPSALSSQHMSISCHPRDINRPSG